MNRTPQRAAIKAAKNVLQSVSSLVLIEEMANIKALVVMAKRVGEATSYVSLSLFSLFLFSAHSITNGDASQTN